MSVDDVLLCALAGAFSILIALVVVADVTVIAIATMAAING